MSIVDFIAVVSFGLTCLESDIPLVRIITRHKNSRPGLITRQQFLSNYLSG